MRTAGTTNVATVAFSDYSRNNFIQFVAQDTQRHGSRRRTGAATIKTFIGCAIQILPAAADITCVKYSDACDGRCKHALTMAIDAGSAESVCRVCAMVCAPGAI